MTYTRLFAVLSLAVAPVAVADALPCEGSGCDAYGPGLSAGAADARAGRAREKVIGAALGGLSGGLIGNEIGDTAGAVIGSAVGVALGMQTPDRKRQERTARYLRDQQLAGTDMSYDPSRPLPVVAHWRATPREYPAVVMLPVSGDD